MPILISFMEIQILDRNCGPFFFVCLGQLAYTNHLSGKLQKAETKCTAKIQEIEQKQLKALAEKQNKINKVSANYETAKSAQHRQIETVTREV